MLKKSVYEKMITLVINSVPSALLAVDKYGRIVYLSTIRYSRVSIEKIIGKSFDRIIKAIFDDEKVKLVTEAYDKCKKEQKLIEISRVCHVSSIGVKCYYNLKFLYDDNEQIVVCFIQNVTENVLLEEEFTMITEEYEEMTTKLRREIAELDINIMDMTLTKN